MTRMMVQRRNPHRWSKLGRLVAVLVLALMPATTALAARDEVEADPIDARLEGYSGNVSLPAAGTGLTWMAFIGLMVLAAAGLFKDAKRTHLD